MNLSRSGVIFIIIAACFLSRLPLLLDPELILDGDECIVAMMAKAVYTGKGFPMFFYGQNYGFAFIEVLTILPFYILLGVGTYAVKFAMLSLWTAGVVFFYLALKQLASNYKWLPLICTLLLIACPGWAVFSMKAYGGYITAFTLSNIVLFLLFRDQFRNKTGTYIMIGILLGLIFQAHVLWLPGLFPFITYHFYKNGNYKKLIPLFIPLIAITITFYFYKQGLSTFNISGRYNPKNDVLPFTARIPSFLYCTMHGHHELWMSGAPGFLCGLFAYIITGITLLLPVAGIIYFFKDRSKHWLFIASAVAVLLNLAYTIFTFKIQGKYMLPIIAYAVLSLFIFLASTKFNKWVYGSVISLTVLGMLGVLTFKTYSYPKTYPAALSQTFKYLKDNNVQYVYGMQGMLVWQIIFYSDEKIIARPYKYPGRYTSYGITIDSAYNNGVNTAVVGYTDPSYNEYEYPDGHIIRNMFIFINPPKERLSKRFEFRKGELYTPYQ